MAAAYRALFSLVLGFRLQFRAEFFNLFNKAQFAPPASLTVETPTFGRLSSFAHDPREIQFALKLNF